jgi:DNA (cytosine-5)-methyltransferase 1
MKVVSTFAGCGGSSTGYKQAGCEVVACVEWDDHAVQCYGLNHPSTKIFHGDIHKVTGAAILNATGLDVGELDILDGSPPCQGFSTAGRRILDDPRNSLFNQQLRLIDELRPKHVVIENVAGMVKGAMKSVAAEIFTSLKERGYRVAAGVMEAQYFGVSQIRARTFFIGSRLGQPRLPRPISRPIPSRVALAEVEPDEVIGPWNPGSRLMSSQLRPGESGLDVMRRIGKKDGWFNCSMLDPNTVAPTIPKSMLGYGCLWHWDRRHISIREALALTGFPLDYKLPGKFEDRWARIGNSVAPPMSREIALQSLSRI